MMEAATDRMRNNYRMRNNLSEPLRSGACWARPSRACAARNIHICALRRALTLVGSALDSLGIAINQCTESLCK